MRKITGKNSQVKSKVKEVKKKIRMNTCCVLNSSDFQKPDIETKGKNRIKSRISTND